MFSNGNNNNNMVDINNLIINKNIYENGRVTLVTANACITIAICPTTKNYTIEGRIDTDKNFGTAHAKNMHDAFDYVQNELKIDLKNVIKII